MKEEAPKNNPRKHLLELKKGFVDEVPLKMLHDDRPEKMSLVRRNFFTALSVDLYKILRENLIKDKETKEEINQFHEFLQSDGFRHKPLVDAEDLARAIRIIDKVVEKLPA